MNDNLQQLHDKTDDDFARRLFDALPKLPALATEDQQDGKARPRPMRVYAEVGIFPVRSNLPEAPTSTGCCDSCASGLVCEDGCAGVRV